jgi:mono/diheme cytochrome c family protein
MSSRMKQSGRPAQILLLGLAAVWAASVVLAATPADDGRDRGDAASFPNIEDHFKYGSIGTEERVGVPYWIWRVLPIVFADKLPARPGEGYERIGFLYDKAPHGRPIGTSFLPGQFARVGLNCATCHVGTYREDPGSPRRIVVGMPANQMNLQSYLAFLSACANDPRFTYDVLMPAMQKEGAKIGWFTRLIYRWFVIGRVRDAILEGAKENAWFDARPPQGPGRVDTFNPYKVMLGFQMTEDKTVGTVDLPSIWNQKPRRGLWLHWDGNNDSVEERNKSAAIGAGATPDSLDLPSMTRLETWLDGLPRPPVPSGRIDRAAIGDGERLYRAECASCHEFGAAKIGQVTAIDEIGTDRERLDSFTEQLASGMNTIGRGEPWQFKRFRKTNGYANMPLDGLWLRAPYLHNGSVPTLRALLFPEERPATFYRAYDVYDWKAGGFVSSGPDAERDGVLFDTSLRGNGNRGHLYGTRLSKAEREQLLAYLKTF